jgi:CheY-like chemotaxis protein
MPTILVVDDSRVDRSLAAGLLQKRAGWKVELAADGMEAISRLEHAPADVVLTDLVMPRMDVLLPAS